MNHMIARHISLVTLLFVYALFANISFASQGGLTVVQINPSPRSINAPIESTITINFNQTLNSQTLSSDSFRVFGRWSGPAEGVISLSTGGSAVVFTPTNRFSAGEQVMVTLSNQIEADNGTTLSSGYSFQFWTATAASPLNFQTIDTMTTRTDPNITSRAYGGIATDLNNDGWLDLSIINEDTADIRTFLNQADGSGRYQPFLQPTSAVNDRASPNEPADFNNDGNADIAVGNINTNSLSVLLGNGDGTFLPQQEIAVGAGPRGVAVLDIEGDGDIDIINTNSNGAGSLSMLLNDGNGVFSNAGFFDGGGSSEWSLGAADMNEDGLLDIVLSANISGTPSIIVRTNNGDGSFTQSSSQAVMGLPWMLNLGDLNGDGHEDVAVVNSVSDNGSILLGDGNGNLGPATHYATDPFSLATDLGDIDGDNDLDWVTSSFNGDWFLFLNDGNGSFTFDREIAAPVAASCALLLDIDNDNILDLALIDELADQVILVKNGFDVDGDGFIDEEDNCVLVVNAEQVDSDDDGYGNSCDGDFNNDCIVNFSDISLFTAEFLGTNPLFDLNNDGNVNFIDYTMLTDMFLQPPGPGNGMCK